MCRKPFRQGVAEYGCGQCMPCRFNRRRLWVTRLMLERQLHEHAFVATLTYSDENLPEGGNVSLRDAQLFLKRLRRAMWPGKLRYYIVGEYGEMGSRPHYHAVLFGVSEPTLVVSAWGLGGVYLDLVSDKACSYVVSYVTKRMTGKEDVRLAGKKPEFARMSLKPGIGFGATEIVGNALTSRGGASSVAKVGDVPRVVRFEGGKWPVGRYLLRQIRREVGMVESRTMFGRAIPSVGYVVHLRELQSTLMVKGAREARENERIGAEARVNKLLEISASRKGNRL